MGSKSKKPHAWTLENAQPLRPLMSKGFGAAFSFRPSRSRTREELVRKCWNIFDSAIAGGSTGLEIASAQMADLLIELTGNQGVEPKQS